MGVAKSILQIILILLGCLFMYQQYKYQNEYIRNGDSQNAYWSLFSLIHGVWMLLLAAII